MGLTQAKVNREQERKLGDMSDQLKEKTIRVASIFLGMKELEKCTEGQIDDFLLAKGLTREMIHEAKKRYQEEVELKFQRLYPNVQKLPPPALYKK